MLLKDLLSSCTRYKLVLESCLLIVLKTSHKSLVLVAIQFCKVVVYSFDVQNTCTCKSFKLVKAWWVDLLTF